jgi:hypothetical protein
MSLPRRTLAAGMPLASTALLLVGVAAAIARPGVTAADVTNATFALPVAAFSIVGGVVSARRPGNAIGWLLAAIGLLFAVVVASSTTSAWALETHAVPRSLGEWISVPSCAWVPALTLIGTQLPMRLPDGRLPSRRWRWLSRGSLVLMAVALVGIATQTGRVEGVAGTASPLASEALQGLAPVLLLVVACFVAALAALVGRYRRATLHDRVKLRWMACGGGVFLAVFLVTLPLAGALGLPEDSSGATAIHTVTQQAFAALPISIGYAILKHRLYDIDVVVNRTLVYGTLTATLASAYLVSVLVLQLLLGGITGDSGMAVAASTLAVAALFRPARARIQGGVDRRFYRRKYDAQRTLAAFAARLRDEVALDALSAELRGVVAETMEPAHVSLWLHREAERR